MSNGKNELKIDNMHISIHTDAKPGTIKINGAQGNTSKDMPEHATKQGIEKHVIIFVGGGEFTDSHGHKWHNGDEQTYTDEEYKKRTDLHFMVNYGEMRHTSVTI